MSAPAAPAPLPDAFGVFRDDGPLARALSATARRAGSPAPVALVLAGVLPLVVLAIVLGDDAPRGVAAGALAWLVLLGGASGCRTPAPTRRWAIPPLLRLGEYGALIWISALDSAPALPAAFALLCVLAFRHYDLVYRFRHRGELPPAWVNTLTAGWDGRLVIAFVLLLLGGLPGAMYVWAVVLGVAMVTETVIGWRRFERLRQPVGYDDVEDDD
jgi:hypothetical protein